MFFGHSQKKDQELVKITGEQNEFKRSRNAAVTTSKKSEEDLAKTKKDLEETREKHDKYIQDLVEKYEKERSHLQVQASEHERKHGELQEKLKTYEHLQKKIQELEKHEGVANVEAGAKHEGGAKYDDELPSWWNASDP